MQLNALESGWPDNLYPNDEKKLPHKIRGSEGNIFNKAWSDAIILRINNSNVQHLKRMKNDSRKIPGC